MSYEFKRITDFEVGMSNSVTRTMTEADVAAFGGLSMDFNPVHFNHEYAKTTMFKAPIVQGNLVASLLTGAGAPFTGMASIYVKDERFFAAPVFIGDTITATVEVADLNVEKKNMHLKATCTNQKGEVVVSGKITIKFID